MSMLRRMLRWIDSVVENPESSMNLHYVAAAAYREVLQAERTKELWSNPLALFSYDPAKLDIVNWNAGLAERRQELNSLLQQMRQRIADLSKS